MAALDIYALWINKCNYYLNLLLNKFYNQYKLMRKKINQSLRTLINNIGILTDPLLTDLYNIINLKT